MLWCGRAVTSQREGLPCPVMATTDYKQRQNTVLKVGGVGREEHVWSEGCE